MKSVTQGLLNECQTPQLDSRLSTGRPWAACLRASAHAVPSSRMGLSPSLSLKSEPSSRPSSKLTPPHRFPKLALTYAPSEGFGKQIKIMTMEGLLKELGMFSLVEKTQEGLRLIKCLHWKEIQRISKEFPLLDRKWDEMTLEVSVFCRALLICCSD